MTNLQWAKNKIAAKVQSVILVVSLAALLGLMGWLLGGGLLALILIGSLVMLYFFGPMMSPAFILKINSGCRLFPSEAPQLYDILQRLSRRAKLTRLPELFFLPTDAMLAFTIGSRDNAAIAVSKGLIRRLSWQELDAVLAHEISHIRHNDVQIMAFAGLTGQFTSLLSVFGQLMLLFSLPMILAGQMMISWLAIFLLIFSPTLSSLLQLGLSRAREYNADMSAAELTGNPEALATALAKIDRFQKNLFSRLIWPMVPRLPQASWLRTHPPTKERIRRLLEVRDYNQLPQNHPYKFKRNQQSPIYRVAIDSF
jgi:heat shock protein HtpX